MSQKRKAVDEYRGQNLVIGPGPFAIVDRATLEGCVGPVTVSKEGFSETVLQMNEFWRAWVYERAVEGKPTERQFVKWLRKFSRKSLDLAALVQDDADASETDPVFEPHELLPAVIPYDEEWLETMRLRGGGLESLPPDTTSDADGSLSWRLDRIRDAFDVRYFGDPPKAKPFEFGNEAMLELNPLLLALARAAQDEILKLAKRPRSDPAEPTQTPTANHRLFERLVPIYEAMFSKEEIARSSNPTPKAEGKAPGTVRATGPAVRFYRFVFDRLDISDAPADNTIGKWIYEYQHRND